MKCWICGNQADSCEHKIKKSLLVKIFENDFKNSKVLHLKNNKFSEIQGPNSKKIKYEHSICSHCNNTKTQPFDKAYDKFFEYIQNEANSIIEKRVIDFYNLYGKDWEQDQLNLFKYFVKLFGCDLRSVEHIVPFDLPEILERKTFKTALKISFAIHKEKLGIGDPNDFGMGIGPLVVNQKSKTNTQPIGYKWSIFFSFIHIFFWYNFIPDGPFGAPWIADSRYIYLGYF